MPMLLEMLESQKYPDLANICKKTLPKVGYIAFIDNMPVAAGFLRRLEPCYAHLDTLCSNAYCGSLLRHEGIKLVVDSLIEDAKRLKLKGIVAFTKDVGTLERAKTLGFHVIPQTMIALPL